MKIMEGSKEITSMDRPTEVDLTLQISTNVSTDLNGLSMPTACTGISSAIKFQHNYITASVPSSENCGIESPSGSISNVHRTSCIDGQALEICSKEYNTVDVARTYLSALRPWSFSTSLIPLLLGTALGYKEINEVNLFVFFFTAIAILSVHGAGNLVNTYYDFKRGIDSKKSDDRTLVDQKLSPQEVASFGACLYAIGCASVLCICLTSKASVEHIALVFFGGLSGSFLYTGGIGLKYHAFGDIVIILSFGPVAVMFTFICQTGLLKLLPFWYAIPVVLITEAIVHANNSRDAENDMAANVTTVAIMLGPTASYILFCFLLFIPYIIIVVLGVNFSKAFFLPFLTLTVAFKLEKEFRRGNLKLLPYKTAQLNLLFGVTYVMSCLLTSKEYLPGF